ncbi:hypothetical protein NHX12_003537 [Muraenolepis orangiensis]|uniref:Ubiquitin-like domain-containing protein n=1 Tax=Muraenolepis orangiensis TaxID=630683 RepID=A0A9Q0E305_9TELE|nr:hypothetical protein NHX12_003537 [Muraenolepis orangiensis]
MDREGTQQQRRSSAIISLLIKTPSQTYGDQLIDEVDLRWTVEELKRHLATVYPDNPSVSDQRLIYAGKLLPNHLHLKDILKQMDSTPTLHLVCSVRSRSDNPLGARPKVREAQQLHPQPMTESTVSGPGPAPASPFPGASSSSRTQAASVPPELRQRLQASAAPGSAPVHGAAPATATRMHHTADMAQPSFPTYSLYSPQQLLWLQHVYARQYYMQ